MKHITATHYITVVTFCLFFCKFSGRSRFSLVTMLEVRVTMTDISVCTYTTYYIYTTIYIVNTTQEKQPQSSVVAIVVLTVVVVGVTVRFRMNRERIRSLTYLVSRSGIGSTALAKADMIVSAKRTGWFLTQLTVNTSSLYGGQSFAALFDVAAVHLVAEAVALTNVIL